MAIARSLAIAAEANETKRVAARAAYYAARHRDHAIREALSAFASGISAAASTAMLQVEQAVAARRDDGMPLADDQLSGASRWDRLATEGRRQANRDAAAPGAEQAPDGMHLDVAIDNEADGADATWYVAIPSTVVVVDDDGNAERTTLHVIGSARIVERDAGLSVMTYVSLKRETERDDIPCVVHVDPSCIPHATLLSACERIARLARADGVRAIPDTLKLWCSVGRYAGASDAPGWAYTGWSWLSFDRATERTKQAKARGSKRVPLYRPDVSRAKRAKVVASQVSVAERAEETAQAWPIGHDVSTAIAESAVARVVAARKLARKSSKVQDVTERIKAMRA